VILGIDPKKYKTVCIYLARRSEEPSFFEQNACRVFCVGGKTSLDYFRPGVAWALSRVLRQEGVDILHCHKHKATVYGVIGAALARTPVVISHVHGLDRTRNVKRKVVNFFLFRKVTRILTTGKAVRDDVLRTNRRLSPDKVISVGNSIDFAHFATADLTKSQARRDLALPVDSIVFGTVGRLVPTKGQPYLLDAFAAVKKRMPLAQLVLAGDGGLNEDLQERARQTSCADSIHFLGYRKDINKVLRAIDVFVLPSVAEGLPKSLLEAMAAGVPCVASRVGGIPEVLGDGEFGFLVPPKDEKALAEAMMNVANMPDADVRRLTQKAQDRVASEYVHDVVIKTLESLYSREMESYHAGSRR
jgi:glycosyltransferase involved in cell wall biosynthesis